MNINAKHGELSSAIKSPKLKTKSRINSPSDVCRAVNKYEFFNGIPCFNTCLCFSVLFVNIFDLGKNLARGSETRLRALLIKPCFCTEIYFKIKI